MMTGEERCFIFSTADSSGWINCGMACDSVSSSMEVSYNGDSLGTCYDGTEDCLDLYG